MPAAIRCTMPMSEPAPPPSSAHLILLIAHVLVPERQREQHENDGGEAGRELPDRLPVVDGAGGVVIGDFAGGPESDQHAGAVGGKGDQALSSALDVGPCFRVDVDLSRHEEKVVAHAVQSYP